MDFENQDEESVEFETSTDMARPIWKEPDQESRRMETVRATSPIFGSTGAREDPKMGVTKPNYVRVGLGAREQDSKHLPEDTPSQLSTKAIEGELLGMRVNLDLVKEAAEIEQSGKYRKLVGRAHRVVQAASEHVDDPESLARSEAMQLRRLKWVRSTRPSVWSLLAGFGENAQYQAVASSRDDWMAIRQLVQQEHILRGLKRENEEQRKRLEQAGANMERRWRSYIDDQAEPIETIYDEEEEQEGPWRPKPIGSNGGSRDDLSEITEEPVMKDGSPISAAREITEIRGTPRTPGNGYPRTDMRAEEVAMDLFRPREDVSISSERESRATGGRGTYTIQSGKVLRHDEMEAHLNRLADRLKQEVYERPLGHVEAAYR
ncbi:hypothetical protein, partial [Porticoccus sp.]